MKKVPKKVLAFAIGFLIFVVSGYGIPALLGDGTNNLPPELRDYGKTALVLSNSFFDNPGI